MTIKWDAKVLRFRADSGRFIKRTAVTDALERARTEGRKQVAKLTDDLKAGRINLPAWQVAMRDEIKAQHLLHAGIARGGKANLSPAGLGRVGQLTRVQYERLNNYARSVANGMARPSVGRSQMYVNAAHATFAETERRMYRNAGFDEERNVLHAAEHCAGCQAQAARGWVPIGTLTRIGARECRTNDACSLEYRKAA